MKITKQATDEVILGELGGRLAQARLGKNLTQAQLAMQAGISKRTVERLESGAVGTQLSAFIRVCRVLDLLEQFEHVVPVTAPSPIAQLKSGGRQRRRASAVAGTPPGALNEAPPASGTWTWGDKS